MGTNVMTTIMWDWVAFKVWCKEHGYKQSYASVLKKYIAEKGKKDEE